MPDIPNNSSTTTTITVGGTLNDVLEVNGDHDWVMISLVAGQQILISLDGVTLEDPLVVVRDAVGNPFASNDDSSSGLSLDSRLVFTAPTTGNYYIDVGAYNDAYSGSYSLSVQNYVLPPVATYETIAEHLTSGYWNGETHRFNVTQGGTITVNLTALSEVGQTLAREALLVWSDVIGITFTEVSTGGQITFDDNEEGAFAEADWDSAGITSSAHVNVSLQWLADYGMSLNSYAFQTFIHEIGHALGLGHGGFYNSIADYTTDASFANDGWPATIMSYFDQNDNRYFDALNFSRMYILTPMLADVRGMATLYGLSSTTRTGDTTYGFNNNSGRATFDSPNSYTVVGAYTIVDSGGVDTLNYSVYNADQIINLNQETFSDIGGRIGNVSIAFGTVIENAIGGHGIDTIFGNSANNVLDGGSGDRSDVVSYAYATAGVTVSLGIAGPQDTIGAGIDTLIGFEELHGSDFNDILTGGVGYTHVRGGGGNDIIIASADGDFLFGGDGDDTFYSGPGSDQIYGGDGFDTIDYSGATAGVNSNSGQGGADGSDWLGDIERQIGSPFDDILQGVAANGANVLIGGAGNDILWGSYGADLLTGGPGRDTFYVANSDTITDFSIGDRLIFTDATMANFTFSLSGSTLTFTGGTLTLTGGVAGQLFASPALSYGVQLTIGPADSLSDFNGDGRSDILWRNADGSLSNWLGQTNGGFLGNDANAFSVVPTSWQIAGVGDFNGDGHDDLLWRNVDGQLSDWLGHANGGFTPNDANASTNVPTSWQVAGIGDFNRDGYDDILWRNSDGTLSNWLGTASGGFTPNDANARSLVSTSWQVAGVGDFNGDGRDDILWRNSDGTLSNWLGASGGSFNPNDANALSLVSIAWQVAGVGDFNGDGRDDILWRSTNGQMSNWLATANGGFVNNDANAFASVPTNWHIVAVGDYNGDGRDDILWRSDTGQLSNWLANANGGFTGNDGNALTVIPTSWHVLPEHPMV